MKEKFDSAWPLLWAACGIALAKVVEVLMSRPNSLRIEIERLSGEIKLLNTELSHWKNQFYRLLDATIRNDQKALHTLLSEHGGITDKEE